MSLDMAHHHSPLMLTFWKIRVHPPRVLSVGEVETHILCAEVMALEVCDGQLQLQHYQLVCCMQQNNIFILPREYHGAQPNTCKTN